VQALADRFTFWGAELVSRVAAKPAQSGYRGDAWHQAGTLSSQRSRFPPTFWASVVQVSSLRHEWLRQCAAAWANAKVVAHVKRATAETFNVTGKVPGSVRPYLNRRPDLIKRAHAWIFRGSDIGSPGPRNRIHASDDALEHWAVAAMQKGGLAVKYESPAQRERSRGDRRYSTRRRP
jgi:hypothetical protein